MGPARHHCHELAGWPSGRGRYHRAAAAGFSTCCGDRGSHRHRLENSGAREHLGHESDHDRLSEEIQLQGHTDITDVINHLPQNIIGSNADFGNTSSPLTSTGGFSTVDLRGLGPQRTLVLVNGRRLGTGDPSTSNQNVAPDIDQIPAPLIERVDVVTGGASATYGSDAIAGVVNFILKKDFQGIQIDGQYGFSQHDQHNSYVQGLLGANDPDTGFTAQPTCPPADPRWLQT